MSKAPTKSERERMAAIADMGCIVCLLFFDCRTEAAVHHLVDGNRLGHAFTIPLCPWHHQGIPPTGTFMEAQEALGPCCHGQHVAFEKRFGTEYELLEATNERVS